MKRITTWLAVTLSVVGMATWYQTTGSTGHEKEGEQPAAQTAAGCSGNGAPRAPAPAGATATSTTDDGASTSTTSSGDKAGDPCSASDHTGKPGERK